MFNITSILLKTGSICTIYIVQYIFFRDYIANIVTIKLYKTIA